MIKFIINAISNAIGFSKVEARGTLLLIFIMLFGIAFSRMYVQKLKTPTEISARDAEALEEWVAEVSSSYQQKAEHIDAEQVAFITPTDYTNTIRKKKSVDTAGTGRLHRPNAAMNELIEVKDLNTATTEELQKVKGIGPAYSGRILKFRNLLGGFSTTDQLKEVYNLPPETIEELKKYFAVLTPPIPININSDSARVLAKHPYISYDLAWIIINYRKQHGNIQKSEQLRNIHALDEETIMRLKPYID